MLSPQERAESARRRLLEAVENFSARKSVFPGCGRPFPISSVALALLAGFVVGYSPGIQRILMNNIIGLTRFVANIKL